MNDVKITIKNYRCFSDTKPAQFILKNGLTSFIGVNNVGKSSLLKFFYEFRNLFKIGITNDTINKGRNQTFAFPLEVRDPQEIFYNGNSRPLEIEFYLLDNLIEENNYPAIKKIKIIVLRDASFSIKLYSSNKVIDNTNDDKVLGIYGKLIRRSGSRLLDDEHESLEISRIITVLDHLKNTFYVGAFRNAINPFTTEDLSRQRSIQEWHSSYYDINIGAKIIQLWKEFKNGNNLGNRQKAIELTKQICQIFNFQSLDISLSANEYNFLFSINEKSYNLSDIGSGIAQFFVVLANIVIKQPSFILIDEPEINLHPSLQLEFLNILESYASNGVLYATHSVGLARHADQVYSVFKEDNISNIREFEKRSPLSELLGELSYSAYRELGFKKVLLVEGRTEIKVMQQFLRKYDRDHEFFVVSLGGSQYICGHSEDELREFMRTSDKIFAIIDSEKTAEDQNLDSSRQAFISICNNLNIDCHVLKRRATDNYFPDIVIKQVKGQNFQALAPYQKLGETTQGIQHWAKSENWCFAQAMTKEQLEETDLGIFIKRICEINN